MRKRFNFSLGWYTTALQAEVYGNKPCADGNTKKSYWKKEHLYSL
jgi:hypothetical protein